MKRLAELFDGRRVHAGTTVFVTTSNGVLSAARALGYAQKLEAAGVTILEGVCVYILQGLTRMRAANGWTNMISNSAKIVNTITAHKFNTILRRTPTAWRSPARAYSDERALRPSASSAPGDRT